MEIYRNLINSFVGVCNMSEEYINTDIAITKGVLHIKRCASNARKLIVEILLSKLYICLQFTRRQRAVGSGAALEQPLLF